MLLIFLLLSFSSQSSFTQREAEKLTNENESRPTMHIMYLPLKQRESAQKNYNCLFYLFCIQGRQLRNFTLTIRAVMLPFVIHTCMGSFLPSSHSIYGMYRFERPVSKLLKVTLNCKTRVGCYLAVLSTFIKQQKKRK